MTLRLGHIIYSNCFPVHARLLDRPQPDDPVLVEGIPSLLNGLLERGEIDVAPCSSIEFARHADRYRLLPDLVIGCRGPVRSILLLSSYSPEDLNGRTVALPTASATSVVLLKILCRIRWKVAPRWLWFDQAREDPFARGADAALFIGDVALRPGLHRVQEVRLDLGQEWWQQMQLPFAFAVWQAGSGSPEELSTLHTQLVKSRRYGHEHLSVLANKYAAQFGLPAPLLEPYWRELRFELDEEMLEGLDAFYRCAAEIGELASAPALRFVV
ncbi:menaquinone biosynthesis protein [soil metagenome]